MPRDPKKYLFDMDRALSRIERFVAGKTYQDYQADELLRSAVERQLEIIGEALNQLAKSAPEIAGQIPEHRRIIAFRNLLIHAYAVVDDRLVWGVVEGKLSERKEAVRQRLT